MNNLLIKGGLVINGTGTPGQAMDIRVRNGRITEMAPRLKPDGEQIIDAAGAIVAPGFIDSHTHYDATIFWDPLCDPMPQHGVTTVVAGNCSLSLAPIRAADRAGQMDCLSYIEDLPLEVLNTCIPWSWESFDEYARALADRKLGVNVLSFVGHSQLRSYVMGEAAWERAATPEETAAMVAELDRALAAGALGLSYSLFDKDRTGRWVPSHYAADAEIEALCARLSAHQAVFQFILSAASNEIAVKELEQFGQILKRHNITGLYNLVVQDTINPARAGLIIGCLESLRQQGIRLYALATPRVFELTVGLEQSLCFIDVPAWNALAQATYEGKQRLLADPAWRARARSDADTSAALMFPFSRPEELRIFGVTDPKWQPWVGRTLRDLVAERGGHVSDVLADWMRDNDCRATFVYPVANTDQDGVLGLLKSPVTLVSASDAGAHLQMFCASGDATLLLTRYVRERGDMSIEEAIHAITGHQAEVLGLGDRGVLAPGKAGDFTIFALDELHYGPEVPVNDVPGGLPRLTREPGGYRYTIVNGVIVQKSGKATGELPARWLARAS